MKKKYYLDLTLKEEIVEGRPEYTFFSRKTRTALQDVLEVIACAARDPRIAALCLTLDNLAPGWARFSSIRRSLLRFRRTGKPIYGFFEGGGNLEYYLACVCDQVFMPPASTLHLVGLAAEVFFFRDVLDRFGVVPQLRAVGEYKSAGEMFTRTSMSPTSREQLEALLDDFHREFCTAVSEDRRLSAEQVAALINNGPYSASEALERGLIDGICHQDEVAEKLKLNLKGRVRPLAAGKYHGGEGIIRRFLSFRRPRIGMIYIHGTLDVGESRRDRVDRYVAGASTICKLLDHSRQSRKIRAVVVRVDSPGGTAVAADSVWRKIEVLKKSKPAVVSFGDVAASGGYYLSAPADCIVAESTTITGSIGVLGGKFVAKSLMERLSIQRESVCRGTHAEFDSPFSMFSEEESAKLESQLQQFYREDFLKKVASGRKMQEAEVDRVGRGRVWSGLRARECGLVDLLGGPLEAIQEARRLAHISDKERIRIVHYTRRRRLAEVFIPELRPHLQCHLISEPLRALLDLMEQAARSTILLLLPFEIRIR